MTAEAIERGQAARESFVEALWDPEAERLWNRLVLTTGEAALVTTVPIVAGGELWVNVDCLNGELRVELRSADTGDALPGFSLNDSVPLSANSVAKRVVWAGGDGTVRPGTRLVIVFHLLEARLYSYQFRGVANSSKTDDSAAGGPAA